VAMRAAFGRRTNGEEAPVPAKHRNNGRLQLITAGCIAALVVTVHAALPATPSVSEMLRKVSRVYSGLDDCHIVAVREGAVVGDHSAPPRRSVITLDVGGAGRVRMSLTGAGNNVVLITDGKTIWQYAPARNEYTASPVEEWQEHIANRTNLLDRMQDLLIGRYVKLWEFAKEATFEGVTEIDFQAGKIPCYQIAFHLAGLTDRLWIDPLNYLVLQEMSVQPMTGAGSPFLWSDTIRVINIDAHAAHPADSFTFVPLPDVARVDSLNLPDVGEGFIGASAGEFTLEDIDGKQVSLSDYCGKTVVLTFWATWCLPCKAELPTVQQIYQQRKEDVVVLAVDDESEAVVKDFLKVNHYGFTVLVDHDRTLFRNYAVHFIPTVVIINADGMIVRKIVGWEGPKELFAALDASEH